MLQSSQSSYFRSSATQINKGKNVMNDEYEQKISSLNAKNETMQMEFETMQISNTNIANNQHKLKNDLNESKTQIKLLLDENIKLKQQNQAQSLQIIELNQTIKQLQTR